MNCVFRLPSSFAWPCWRPRPRPKRAGPCAFDELAALSPGLDVLGLLRRGDQIVYAVGQPDRRGERVTILALDGPGARGRARAASDLRTRRDDAEPQFSPDGRRDRLSLRPGRVDADVGDAGLGRRNRRRSRPSRAGSGSSHGRPTASGSWSSPRRRSRVRDGQVRRREARRQQRIGRRRRALPSGCCSVTGTRGRTGCARTSGRSRSPAAAVDLTPGDRTSPVFEVGGAEGVLRLARRARLRLCVEPRQGSKRCRRTPTSGCLPSIAAESAWNLTGANPAFDGSPKYSPDGKWIAYRAQSRARASRRTASASASWIGASGIRARSRAASMPGSRTSTGRRTRARLFLATHQGARSILYRVDLAGAGRTEIWRGAPRSSNWRLGGRLAPSSSCAPALRAPGDLVPRYGVEGSAGR